MAVDAWGWYEVGQAVEQLEGCEAKRLAPVDIGFGEPVDPAGLWRRERPGAGRGVKPIEGTGGSRLTNRKPVAPGEPAAAPARRPWPSGQGALSLQASAAVTSSARSMSSGDT